MNKYILLSLTIVALIAYFAFFKKNPQNVMLLASNNPLNPSSPIGNGGTTGPTGATVQAPTPTLIPNPIMGITKPMSSPIPIKQAITFPNLAYKSDAPVIGISKQSTL